jgi:serine/threonine protein kinase
VKGVVKVYDIFYERMRPRIHIVMEHCGMNLKDFIRKQKNPISTPIAAHLIQQVLEIVAEMHKNKFVHCDIKSRNIMIDNSYKIVFVDFNIAKKITPNSITKCNCCSTVIRGTPGY